MKCVVDRALAAFLRHGAEKAGSASAGRIECRADGEIVPHRDRGSVQAAREASGSCARRRASHGYSQSGANLTKRAMLADIYNWFTEGFNTADLKDARSCCRISPNEYLAKSEKFGAQTNRLFV